ncbi:MAG TPA: long-chain fatty acid--CoA ligase [Pyrinomonadaceae bacterium]|nr:long-chain fatty acid--CoA ligase [Pyrinomonadaceae bacterium]
MTSPLINPADSPRRPIGRGEPLFPDEPATLPELFIKAAERYDRPNTLVYRDERGWQPISSAEVVSRARAIALGLYSLGLRKGDRAAILAHNSPNWTLADAGCQFAGVLDVPIYTTLAPATIAYILNDSGAKAIFIDSTVALEHLRPELPNCPELDHVILFDGTDVNAMTLGELITRGNELASAEPGLADSLSAAIAPGDIATLIYTSGTTGEPKGVMLTHTNIISNVIDAGAEYEFADQDIALSVLPLSHIFERTSMYLYIFNGMAVHFARSIDKVPEDLQEVKPTIFIGVPRIFEKVYAKAKLRAAQTGGFKEKIFDWAIEVAKKWARTQADGGKAPIGLGVKHRIADRLVYSKLRDFFGGRLRYCITGGAALSDDIYLIFTGAGIAIMQGYGLTETSPVVSSNNPSSSRLGSVGKPIRNVDVRIANDGEIEVTGPGVMLGYYHKPEATSEAFTDDGWFRTGDIGELDPAGFLRITDRKKELFKTSGGKYIAPSPIEQMLKSSKFISQAVLVGSERKFAAALIVPNFEMLESYARVKGIEYASPEELARHPKIMDLIERQIEEATEGLARYETVKKFRMLESELTVETGELTPTMKVKRRIVDEKYRHLIEEMYSGQE